MKNPAPKELSDGKSTLLTNIKKIFLPILTLTLLFTFTSFFNTAHDSIFYTLSPLMESSEAVISKRSCNIFNGSWIPFPEGPYYTNETKCPIDDRQNCIKFGRPDSEFMKWRWKPDECELPLFNATQFLEVVTGKTLAFVGDSLARNQMQSLVCLLAKAADPIDISYLPDTRFRRWFYADYNFTIEIFWSPQLVKPIASETDPNGYLQDTIMKLHLDQADEAWSTQIEHADIVIVSAGQWFLRPLIFYEKGQIASCLMCNNKNITQVKIYHGYKMAFRTVFKTLISLKNFTGITFMRTITPSHYENGDWNNGGNCIRTKPFSKEEMKLEGYMLDLYLTQVEEFKAAEKEGSRKGLQFRLLDTLGAMILRPDGHPNQYGHWLTQNKTRADCVHWCMPGPVDTWNQFLLEMLKSE